MSAKAVSREKVRSRVRGAFAILLLIGATGSAVATTGDLPNAAAAPPTLLTDSRGFLDSPARCAPNQTAVAVGRTALSLVAICTDGHGHHEYRGIRLSDRAVLVLPAKSLANGCFGARTDVVYYTVSHRKLLLTAGLRVLRDETMVEYKDYRVAVTEAPLVKQAGTR
ncbi:hypothetical protein TUM20985_45570 [Mycobacterium antarcticum]|uniref:hypothetical protein n=1 Tax=unclassified Mycolicibacterium TaxID=2636767 RepID=UPI002392F1FE|nr:MULTISPECIES: hypothetical protein [unclassified Mycolicibacterium]BDX34010.1 hypothetical protein TUM20985_45570 [Mycolicibacterium sp. TUM20985]GLP82397.1 hypothetical protein TUM20984_38170 [Mycolicibacterium sp. TUM20984]